MKIVIIGGHFSPALSVIEKLKNDEVLYIGRKYPLEGDNALSLEFQALNALGVKFTQIKTGRLQRKFTRHTIPSFTKIPFGFFQSYKILKKFKPDVVVGFGGYLSVPVVYAAFLLKIPIVLHEQTTEAGFANKILARFAKKICISFNSSNSFFPEKKTVLTGNPIREEIIKVKNRKKRENKIPLIYITGGSLGSHKINVLIEKTINKILEFAEVVHQTGDSKVFNDYNRLVEIKDKLDKRLRDRYKLFKFINPSDVGEILVDSDLIVSRAGINSVSEILYLNKPVLFIPLSFSQKDEQRKNAIMAKNLGIAEIFEENNSALEFLELLEKMVSNLDNYKAKNLNIIKDDASEKIIDVIKNAIKSE